MRQAGSQELFSYWNEVRKGRAAPERTHMDPAAIRNVLPDTFLLEVNADRTYPFRMAGTRLSALFDSEIDGRSFVSLWNEAQRDEIHSLLQMVTDGVCPIIAGAEAAPVGFEPTQFELLLLPLRHYGKTHARVMGRISSARRPAWLGLLPVDSLNFRSMRVLQTPVPDADQPSAARPFNRSTDAATAPFEQHGHLRVYTGGLDDEA